MKNCFQVRTFWELKLLNFPLILKLPNTGDQIHRKVDGAKDTVH